LEDSAHNDESFDVEASVAEDVDDPDEIDGLDTDAIIVL